MFPSEARPSAFNPASQATALATAGAVNEDDYEGYGYDPNGNRTSRRLRSGETLTSSYDALNRVTFIDNPNSGSALNDLDITNSYDLIGRLTQSIDGNGHYVRYTHSGFGEVTSEESLNGGIKTMLYDNEGRRTRLNYADGFFVTYDHLRSGEVTHIRENGAQSGPGVLATFTYDNLGRRTYLARGNGSSTTYGYDHASALAHIGHHIPAPSGMFEPFTYFERNSAGQIIGANRNDTLAFTGLTNQNVADTHNGLNQISTTGGANAAHDARGNMTADGTGTTYGYNLLNQLVAKNGATQLYYDPAGRLTQQWNGGGNLDYVGTQLIAESAGSSGPRRYVHGPGTDEPLVMYENGQRRHLHADERGSIVMLTDDTSAVVAINRYDEYGVPQGPAGVGTLAGRFGYTGQAWLPEIGLWYYKARMYDPFKGRFPQTDPIGYEDQINLYAYVAGDPINFNDPSGTDMVCVRGLCTIRADSFNASRSSGRTRATTAAQDRAMVSRAREISGNRFNEGTGYMTGREEGEIDIIAVESQTREVRGRSGREMVVLRDEATFNIPPEATASIHRHISGTSDGMIDETNVGLGDSQTITTGRPGYVLHERRVGVREMIGGRLQHRMVLGRFSSRTERLQIQDNLNRQQLIIDGGK